MKVKVYSVAMAVFLSFSIVSSATLLTGCKDNDKSVSAQNDLNSKKTKKADNKSEKSDAENHEKNKSIGGDVLSGAPFKNAEITVITDRNTGFDKRYMDDSKISFNYVEKKKKYNKSDISKISSFVDKHTKVLIIDVSGDGLLDVFDLVKKNLPGVITVANNVSEFKNNRLVDILKNRNVNSALLTNKIKGQDFARNAIKMGAKSIVLINNSDEEFFREADNYAKNNGINYVFNISVNKNATPKEISEALKSEVLKIEGMDKSNDNGDKNEINPKGDIALYTPDDNLAGDVVITAIENGYIVPDMDTENDGETLQKVLPNLDYTDRDSFEKSFKSYLKSKEMNGRIGLVYEGKKNVPTEAIISIAKYMYENSYMVEECYRDVSLIDRGNRNLNLSINPVYIDNSIGYVRSIDISPRVY